MSANELSEEQLLEAQRSECLEIIETLLGGLSNGSMSTGDALLLLRVLSLHLQALGFVRIERVEVILPTRPKS